MSEIKPKSTGEGKGEEVHVTEDDVINMHTRCRVNGKPAPLKEVNPEMYNAILSIMNYWGTYCILDHLKGMKEEMTESLNKGDKIKTPEEIIKSNIPNGIFNLKGISEGNKPYEAETAIIKICMEEYADQFRSANREGEKEVPESVKKIIEAEATKEEIYEPKYGGKDHSGYDTIMLYEVNDHRYECFEKGALFGYLLASQSSPDKGVREEAVVMTVEQMKDLWETAGYYLVTEYRKNNGLVYSEGVPDMKTYLLEKFNIDIKG